MHEPDYALRFQRSSREGDGRPAPSMRSLTYALITPARNEAQFIERTLESVVSQTQLATSRSSAVESIGSPSQRRA
jgi:hypothetical protein